VFCKFRCSFLHAFFLPFTGMLKILRCIIT
jgi:hypothetical protein